jgi:putative FmdB family regulatory protein
MPIYEYACSLCDQTFEVLQPLGAELTECGAFCRAEGRPGNGAVRKIFSAPAVHTGGSSDTAAPACGRCGRPGPGCE